MITHIKTKGFKGFDLDEDLAQKTIFIGPNRTGKSARAAAISLAVIGYVPFAATKANKKPGEILNDFGQGDKLTVAVTCNETEFERSFTRSGKGSVSQRLRVDKRKVDAQEYAVALSGAGNPKIVDVRAFMDMSDAKKVDSLFDLFPPPDNLKSLEGDIEKITDRVNAIRKDEQGVTAAIQRLTKSKESAPPGTLAEVQEEIKRTTDQIEEKRAEIVRIEANRKRQEAFNQTMDQGTSDIPMKTHDEIMAGSGRGADKRESEQSPVSVVTGPDPRGSIERIIGAMDDAGCVACAARIVAAQELKKFGKEVCHA